jgi:DNA-binding transcriptional MerR regulator
MIAMEVIILKIKAVCDLTGLTARTVRVYIDEQLIAPKFTENYLGRRSFEFSQSDIDALQNIATLRKYGFSIDEIRNILLDSQTSIAIIENVKQRTKIQADEYCERLKALSRVESLKAYSVEELSQILLQGKAEIQIPVELPKLNVKRIVKSAVIFLIVWLPFVLVVGGIINDITTYAYPKINIANVILTLLTLIPSISILVITKLKPNIKMTVKRIILCLCVVAIPFSLVMPHGIVTRSETTDFRYYRDFDPDCLATRNKVFNEVFPMWPHYFENVKNEDGEWEAVYFDAKYYYRFFYGMDYTYDIYAEWPLEADKFGEEVQRVKGVFEKAIADKTYGYKFIEIEKGEYTCLILYSGDEPFQKATNNYQYLIFAYSETANVVRYIYCDSLENGADQPYYLQLDW